MAKATLAKACYCENAGSRLISFPVHHLPARHRDKHRRVSKNQATRVDDAYLCGQRAIGSIHRCRHRRGGTCGRARLLPVPPINISHGGVIAEAMLMTADRHATISPDAVMPNITA